jgi:hypothetical protein
VIHLQVFSHERQTKIYLFVKIGPLSPSPSWLVLMRETWRMVEGGYDDVEVATEGLMSLKVMALLLKSLLWQRWD